MAGKKIYYVGLNLDKDDYDLLTKMCVRLNEPMSQVFRDSLHLLAKTFEEADKENKDD